MFAFFVSLCVFVCGIWGKIEPNRHMIVPTIWMIYACWSGVFCERLKNKNEIIKGLDLRSTSERGILKGKDFSRMFEVGGEKTSRERLFKRSEEAIDER